MHSSSDEARNGTGADVADRASPMVADTQARTGEHVVFLDGLRGLAVMIVFMSHASAKGLMSGVSRAL